MNYTFARHETFHIRTGWLQKGLMAIEKNSHIFLEDINAMDELGIGKNMISSLRYWLQATGLTIEDYSGRKKVQLKTELADLILKNDKYFEDPATFWILHFKLAQNKELATTWYWFFNHFLNTKFTEELFIDRLIMFIRRTGGKTPAISSLKSDFNVFRKMYLYEPDKSSSPEDLKESPFVDLKFITQNDKKAYKVNKPTINILPPEILYFCLLETLEEGENAINVEDVLNKKGSIGKIFKFSLNDLYDYFDYLQEKGYLRLDKHAGLNSISLKINSKQKILNNYYQTNKV